MRRAIERGSNRDRADALEVLSHLGDREASGQFALLLEAGPFREKLPGVQGFLDPPHDLRTTIEDIHQADDRWLRLAAGPAAPNGAAGAAKLGGQSTGLDSSVE